MQKFDAMGLDVKRVACPVCTRRVSLCNGGGYISRHEPLTIWLSKRHIRKNLYDSRML